MSLSDRILGCILGGAVGDALGRLYEGSSPPVRIDDEAEWRISDDTQLTLATCEAITRTGGVDPETIASRMAEWFVQGRVTGVGASTHKALSELARGGHWALVGRRGEGAAGNGAAMRIAPLGFLLDPARPGDRQTLRDVCRITHHHDEAYAGALAVVAAVRGAWQGAWTGGTDLIRLAIEGLFDSRVRDQLEHIERLDPHLPLSKVATHTGNTGYVAESVPLALFAAQRVQSLGFREMIEQLIAVGGDTDTIASMAGQIAGTLVGYASLPKRMLDRLPDEQVLTETATSFAQLVGRT
jgi:ADP-ribosyl-[dinitrogen reductase] hydrolase